MLFTEFDEQEQVVKYLVKSIKKNTVSHGYIFEGNKGIGKLNMAFLFAKSLLCANFDNEPCEICNSCVKINTGNHPDVHVFGAVKNVIKREEMDILIESVHKKAYESDRKIFIIKDSHCMTAEAANTFLKTLEEPIGNTVMILLTENSDLLISTIVSRCQKIEFKNASMEVVKDYIMKKYGKNNDDAKLIAHYSEGILSKADAIAKKENDILKKRLDIIKIYDKIINSDRTIIFELEKYFDENKEDIEEIIEIKILWLRDIYFMKYNLDELIINSDCMDLLHRHQEIIKKQSIDKSITYLTKLKTDIKNSVNYKLVIDNMLVKLQEEVV